MVPQYISPYEYHINIILKTEKIFNDRLNNNSVKIVTDTRL